MKSKKSLSVRLFPFSWRDLLITAGILVCALALCILLQMGDTSDGFASPIFVLAVLLVSRLTNGYLYGLIASVTGVVCVNYVFTSPYWAFNFTLSGYPLTFLTFLAVSVITSTLTTQIKQQERLRLESEKEKMRANLLRSVSHDIRTPLTSIMGATSTLLENAALHGVNTSHITLSVQADGEYARFSVRDDGGGIPAKVLPTLFDGSLKHSETGTGDGKRNMGLGLSVCLAIVRAHGGTMEAKNLSAGAEFSFCLPLS